MTVVLCTVIKPLHILLYYTSVIWLSNCDVTIEEQSKDVTSTMDWRQEMAGRTSEFNNFYPNRCIFGYVNSHMIKSVLNSFHFIWDFMKLVSKIFYFFFFSKIKKKYLRRVENLISNEMNSRYFLSYDYHNVQTYIS